MSLVTRAPSPSTRGSSAIHPRAAASPDPSSDRCAFCLFVPWSLCSVTVVPPSLSLQRCAARAMQSRRVLVLLCAVILSAVLVHADIYLHHPRGGNGRVRHMQRTQSQTEHAPLLTPDSSERISPHSGCPWSQRTLPMIEREMVPRHRSRCRSMREKPGDTLRSAQLFPRISSRLVGAHCQLHCSVPRCACRCVHLLFLLCS